LSTSISGILHQILTYAIHIPVQAEALNLEVVWKFQVRIHIEPSHEATQDRRVEGARNNRAQLNRSKEVTNRIIEKHKQWHSAEQTSDRSNKSRETQSPLTKVQI